MADLPRLCDLSGPFSQPRELAMRCLTCSVDMRLIQVAKDTTMLVEGYQHETWRCGSCDEVEQRVMFPYSRAPIDSVLDTALDVCGPSDELRAPERAWRRAIERLHRHQEELKQRLEELRRVEQRAKWRADFNQAWEALI